MLHDVHGAAAALVLDHDVQLGPIVADRMQAEGESGTRGHGRRGVAEGVAGLEQLGAHDLAGDVHVAGTHPCR